VLDCSASCFQLDCSASCRPATQSGGHAGCRSRRATNGRLPLNLPSCITGLRRDCRGWAGGGEVDARRLDRSRRHRCCGLSRAPRGYVKMHLDTMYHRLRPHGSRKPTRGFSSAVYCCRACAHDRPFERPAAQPRRCAFAVPARF
jgi:hypothetical protein